MYRNCLLLIMACLLLTGCSQKTNDSPSAAAIHSIDSVIIKHFALLVNIMDAGETGFQYSFDQLDATVGFFEHLTEIKSNIEYCYFRPIYLSDDAIEKDYLNWSKWYFQNREFLEWNQESQSIMYKDKTATRSIY